MEHKGNDSQVKVNLTTQYECETKQPPCDFPVDVDPQVDDLNDSSDDETDKEASLEKSFCVHFYKSRRQLKCVYTKYSQKIKVFVSFLMLCLYVSYFSYAMYLHHNDERVTGLLFITVVLTIVVFVKCVPYKGPMLKIQNTLQSHPRAVRIFRRSVGVIALLTTATTIVTEIVMVRPSNLISLTGIVGIIFVFLVTSTHPHKIAWRPVISGLILQYIFALLVLKVPAVSGIFIWCGDMMATILSFSKEGYTFMFGTDFHFTSFIFRLFPLIAFALCVLTVLEHLGALHAVLKVLGRFLALCMGSSPAEALNASANIFLGPIDSLMIIRPFLNDVTPSELHCLMANGMSTVTGSIMGVYVLLGISPDHLLIASVMSAPAALSLSKLSVPETRQHIQRGLGDVKFTSKYRSIMDAASSGAVAAIPLTAAVVANVTAVVSVMKMLNYTLSWFGRLVNIPGLTLQWICSYIFYPLALSLGVDIQDGRRVAELIGVKAFINELVAYTTLGQFRKNRARLEEYINHNYTDWSADSKTNDIILHGWNETLVGGVLTERTEVITTYALCGFANFISVGIIIGCYIVMVPHRKAVIFRYIIRSMMVGHCASLITACIAGLLYQ